MLLETFANHVQKDVLNALKVINALLAQKKVVALHYKIALKE